MVATGADSLGTMVTRFFTGTGPSTTNRIPAIESVAETQVSRKSWPSTTDGNCKFQSGLSALKLARSQEEARAPLGVSSPITGSAS